MSDEYMNLHASLSLDEAALQLSKALEAHPSRQGYSLAGFAFDNLGRFGGSVNHDGFKIHRRGWFSEIWWFIVCGSFKAEHGGVDINIRMSLHPVIKWFAVIWYALIIYLLVISTINWIRSGLFDNGIWFALAFGILFYVRLLYSWMREKQKARRFLSILYNG